MFCKNKKKSFKLLEFVEFFFKKKRKKMVQQKNRSQSKSFYYYDFMYNAVETKKNSLNLIWPNA